jgi:poly(A) polymerase
LRLSNRESARILWLLENAKALIDAHRQPWPRVQRVLIAEGAGDLLEFTRALSTIALASTEDVEFCSGKLQLPPAELDPPALINGNDLAQQGVPPGKVYQRFLEAARDAQLEGRIASKAEALALVDELRRADTGTVSPDSPS